MAPTSTQNSKSESPGTNIAAVDKKFEATTKVQDEMGNPQTLAVEGTTGNVKDNLKDAMRTDLEHKGTH